MSSNPFSLKDQTVVVVGASSGIGAATARLASELGANLILVSRSLNKLEAVRLALPLPDKARSIAVDYLNRDDLGKAFAEVEAVHHVVIPAVADENKKRGAFATLGEDTMQASFDKFWGQTFVVQTLASRMVPGGSVTLFASVAGLKPSGADSGLSVMNGVQAAVMQTGRSLAIELAPVRVNVLAPGVVLTNVWTAEQRDELKTWMESTLPARIAGTADHIAQAAVSLMTNPYISGAVLPVDGGLHLT
ncbi:SDR family oxidoreductase [Roseibium alexandrii]|uniref:3-oxoacyl-[acyl-carrier-protein] reductase FabG n=1 Tax=Roseibium alexandrii TaxID=388408 RepID=A0A0M6ZYY5_9HYPH|nr:SDR family oxidoreductase [Roseibium alexandrii]CTQ67537.1 3-oxoacyl-[acyl-carrier-protein] reductase FabG [Roseibium alexandrii]